MLLDYLVMVILIIVILLLTYLEHKPCHLLYITNSKQKKIIPFYYFLTCIKHFVLLFCCYLEIEKNE